jgi:chromosomal replication initiation ATPase DnaA
VSRQLTFDLSRTDTQTRADFFVSASNARALAALDSWADWPQGKMVLVGPPSAGKSHLSRIWAAETGAIRVRGDTLAGADLPLLAEGGMVVVDDADRVAGNPEAERALFHLHNLLAGSGRLLLTAETAPSIWGIGLADLSSRLEAAGVALIEPADDALLSAVLVKLFADRQIAVSPALITYLAARIDRSVEAARALVGRLDRAALAAGRPVTRALAAELLDTLGQE